jgi:uncharacterized protein YbjT (DUF2867 family)
VHVFLTGATGFVGSHLLQRLLGDGYKITALVRDLSSKQADAIARIPAVAAGQLKLARGNVVDGSGLVEGLRGCDSVIHLVGIISEFGDETFEQVHVRGTQNVVQAAKEAGVRKFVHMSAIGVRPNGISEYQTSKYRGEEAVRSSGTSFVILRPSLIFGPGSAFVTQMVQLMKTAPFIRPVVGSGQSRFRPIYVNDVARCFVDSLVNGAALGKTISLVGAEELTFEELLEKIAACIGVRKRAVHIPIPLMQLAAQVFSFLPVRPPVTRDQLAMLEEGSTADEKEMLQVFKFQPISFAEGLRMYLCPLMPLNSQHETKF